MYEGSKSEVVSLSTIQRMKLNLSIFLLTLLIACTGCQTLTRDGLAALPPGEYLKPAFDGRLWILMNRRADQHKSLTEWLPLGQSPISWRESLGGTFFAEGYHKGSMTSEYEEFIRRMRTLCPQITVRIITSNMNDLYYEWRISGCEKQADQTEIGRYVRSTHGIYRLAYVRKGAALVPDERDKWLSLLAEAKLRRTDEKQ